MEEGQVRGTQTKKAHLRGETESLLRLRMMELRLQTDLPQYDGKGL